MRTQRAHKQASPGLLIVVALLANHSALAQSSSAPSPGAEANSRLEEVVVTARRREESAATTPIAVTVISAAELESSTFKELRDLTASVPGVNLTGSGAGINTVFSIRGRSRGAVGNVQPSVATYVNDVPLPIIVSFY